MIYVDDMRLHARVGTILARWSHLVSIPENEVELIEFALSIGLKPDWIQRSNHRAAHFDVTDRMRKKAIAAGAVPVTARELHRLLFSPRSGV